MQITKHAIREIDFRPEEVNKYYLLEGDQIFSLRPTMDGTHRDKCPLPEGHYINNSGEVVKKNRAVITLVNGGCVNRYFSTPQDAHAYIEKISKQLDLIEI